MDEFTTLISNVGFPIAAFCAMWHMCNTTIKENTAALQECTELIKQQCTEIIKTFLENRKEVK